MLNGRREEAMFILMCNKYWRIPDLISIILYLTRLIWHFSGLSLTRNWRKTQVFHLVRELGKSRCFCQEKGNFMLIYEFRYARTWKIWSSPLSLSLYNSFEKDLQDQVFLIKMATFWTSLWTCPVIQEKHLTRRLRGDLVETR